MAHLRRLLWRPTTTQARSPGRGCTAVTISMSVIFGACSTRPRPSAIPIAVPHGATCVDDVGNVAFTLGRIRPDQRLARSCGNPGGIFGGIFLVEQRSAWSACVQEVRRTQTVLYPAVVDLQANDRRMVAGVAAVIVTMPVSTCGADATIARCKSVVKVAIPQRPGSELPMNARPLSRLTLAPRSSGPARPRVARELVTSVDRCWSPRNSWSVAATGVAISRGP